MIIYYMSCSEPPEYFLPLALYIYIRKFVKTPIYANEFIRIASSNHPPPPPSSAVSAVSASIRVTGACWGFFQEFIGSNGVVFFQRIQGFSNHQIGDPFWGFGDLSRIHNCYLVIQFMGFLNHQIHEVNIAIPLNSREMSARRNFSPPRISRTEFSFYKIHQLHWKITDCTSVTWSTTKQVRYL